MRCQECREALQLLVRDSKEFDDRLDLALHLADCEDCAHYLEDESFWDQSVAELLRRETPTDLRESILAAVGPSRAAEGRSSLQWRDRLRFFWWAGTRDMSWRTWIWAFAWAIFVMLLIFVLRR